MIWITVLECYSRAKKRKVVLGTWFTVGRRLCVCAGNVANTCRFFLLLILLSFNVSGQNWAPRFCFFLSPPPPPKHLKNASPPNPFTHACTAIIEFLLFFRVIGEKPSPLAIFMFMALQFKVWMTAAFWWGAFMTTSRHHTHTHTHTHTYAYIHVLNRTAVLSSRTNLLSVTGSFRLLMASFE